MSEDDRERERELIKMLLAQVQGKLKPRALEATVEFSKAAVSPWIQNVNSVIEKFNVTPNSLFDAELVLGVSEAQFNAAIDSGLIDGSRPESMKIGFDMIKHLTILLIMCAIYKKGMSINVSPESSEQHEGGFCE